MYDIPSLFIYNAILVMSDQLTSKGGTITSGEDRFMEWKTTDGNYENTQYAQFDTFFEGIFQKERLLDIIKNFICFSDDGTKEIKILAGYHQYFAVKKAIESTKKATVTDGKGGVFWHTQGSGKSLSMLNTGDFAFDTVVGANVQILERIEMWGYTSYKVFNPATGRVYKATEEQLNTSGSAIQYDENYLRYVALLAKIKNETAGGFLSALASGIIPLR